MSDIIFKKNKPKYLFFLLLLFVILFFISYFSILFISNPSKYISVFFRNELIVYLFSILGILGSLILTQIIVKSVFNKNFFIRINQKGLFIGIIQYSNKLIYWDDITKIKNMKINNIEHIIIYIKNIEYYKDQEKGIQKYFFITTTKKYGTPFVINTSALNGKVTEITEAMIQDWQKFK